MSTIDEAKPSAAARGAAVAAAFGSDDASWYKDAVIYELHVRAFCDSNGDGMGDFVGLTRKLDYLQDLGVTALWLLPFYPSPWKDDGYDIADYNDVHPAYGTLRSFQQFLREAQRRGLRVITELVVNHTSDQHPWFQRARRSAPGSRERDFYVWSDTPDRYADARIIFKDFESSNWSWDPVARAYYWHRFYAHQPDLNFNNPAVRKAVLRAMEFWLEMGVDGLRLDAVPYLYEREGTSCENLPETHQMLKELRARIDERFPNRMLLAEANQWPEDAVEYFGAGDECHMAFHFPLMPRLFMGIRMEDRYPIEEILRQTPAIPDASQWALFLRNHDELTLEMVTDAERDYMYKAYARESHARINLGIRRRLAPLLGNNRRQIELMNSLLLSLPGTPVLYYGDEIGMGDNIYLGDRNGVRTPMQWSADRNAGFSTGNPQRLYLPLITDSVYHFESLNVETQQNNLHSLLWWTKRLLALRKRYRVFGRGSIEFLHPENRKLLAFLRRWQDECILVVANLSRFVQYVHLDLSTVRDRVPVELFGRTPFPAVTDAPYFLTLGPHAFFWFSLEPAPASARTDEGEGRQRPASLSVAARWQDLLSTRGGGKLEAALLDYVRGARWFGGKARTVRSAELAGTVAMSDSESEPHVVFLRVHYSHGDPETYVVALACERGEEARRLREAQPHAVVAEVTVSGFDEPAMLYDALCDERFGRILLDGIERRRQFVGDAGKLVAMPTRALKGLRKPGEDALEPTVLRAEQSNSSIAYRDASGRNRFVLKLFRRIEGGMNPELEIGKYLTEVRQFPNTAPVAGWMEYRPRDGEPQTIACLQSFVQNEGDAWTYTLDAVGDFYERVLAGQRELSSLPRPSAPMFEPAGAEAPDAVAELVGPYVDSVRLLGQRTAEMHLALAAASDDPGFAPEPFSDFYRQSLYHGMTATINEAMLLLRRGLAGLSDELRPQAEQILTSQARLKDRLRAIRERRITALRIRVHGDFHLGQVLFTGKDFIIIDFEGEPARPLSERRIKRSALRDVAAMIRSFDYAARSALSDQTPGAVVRVEDRRVLESAADLWRRWVTTLFLGAYVRVASAGEFLPRSGEELRVLNDAYLVEKAAYELCYELNNRPDWVGIPLGALHRMLSPGA